MISGTANLQTASLDLPCASREWSCVASISNLPSFVVASWNILADCYASRAQHPQCPPGRLSWTHRMPLILAELAARAPDILCLQELDQPEHLGGALQLLGYRCEFRARLRDPQANQIDGCAIFWKEDKVRLILKREVQLDDVVHTDWLQRHFSSIRTFQRHNIAMFCLFETVSSSERIIVATTHLYWDPKLTHVKLAQATHLLRRLERFVAETRCHRIVLNGDFNSLPDSAVYELISQGHVSELNQDRQKFFQNFDAINNLPMRSAYAALGEPCTNWTTNFKGCLDYVFYSQRTLILLYRLAPQSASEPRLVQSSGASPNEYMPSDHTLLMAAFGLLDTSSAAYDLLNLPTSVLHRILSIIPRHSNMRQVSRRWSVLIPCLYRHLAGLAGIKIKK